MKTSAEKFNEHIERELSFERSFGLGGRNALCDKEKLAWELHESAGPAGNVLLGDTLIRGRVSFLRKDVDVVPFARRLLEEGFAGLVAKENKESWDWYYLGICHEFGRGTPVDHGQAAQCFRKAQEAGNPYAEYEEIWSAYLSGAHAVDTIFRFRDYSRSGRLQDFASRSANALTLLEIGPVREVGSAHHVFRILEISNLLREFYYHAAGSRHINVRVEKEMKQDVGELKLTNNPVAALALFLISQKSRTNPTGEEAAVWLRRAIHPENSLLVVIARRENWSEEQFALAAKVCEDNGWQQSDIGRLARWGLERSNDGYSEDGR